MNKNSILFYSIFLLVAVIAIFTPIWIKFLHSGLSFRGFLASLEYGIDVATTIGFVGAIFVFLVTKHKEHREEKQLKEEKQFQEDQKAEHRRLQALEDEKKKRTAQLLDNSRSTTINFLQQTNDDISESLVQFRRLFENDFHTLEHKLNSELKILEADDYDAFMHYANEQAQANDKYAFSYELGAPEFTCFIRNLEKEFSNWSVIVEKTVRGRFFNLLPIIRSTGVALVSGQRDNAEKAEATDESERDADFLRLLENVVKARTNLAMLLLIYDKLEHYFSTNLENQVFDDQADTSQYFQKLIETNREFSSSFSTIFTESDGEKYGSFLKEQTFSNLIAKRDVLDKLVFSIVKPPFKGRSQIFEAINKCVSQYIEYLEDIAIYCAALQEAILKAKPCVFDEAYDKYRDIMKRAAVEMENPFQHEENTSSIRRPRFTNRRKSG